MESLQPTSSLRGESLSRRLHYLLAPCHFNIKTTRFSSAILVIVVCTLCLILFNLKSAIISSSSIQPAGISMSEIDALRQERSRTKDSKLHLNSSGETLTAPHKSKTLPGVIIIGARKAGTRALLDYLNVHPQVMAARQEIHFFSNERNYGKGLRWYMNQMPFSTPDQLTMEKTPNYLVSSVTPARVHRMNSSVLLLLTLRHPVTRAISDYTQILANRDSKGLTSKDFAELAINSRTGEVTENYRPVWVSTYHLHVARWLQLFPLRQIHFVDGDRLITEPLTELRGVENFLGVQPFFTSDIIYFNTTRGFHCMRVPVNGTYRDSCLGKSKGRKHPPVEEWVKTKLNEYFHKHNERLFKLIGRRFDWT
ncbi:hypothetical protein RRG08_003727 [Elysia crispata]|uniref:Sulfotransferase domain-containing protein n=1 Tax=Elysia crispata TaxID=231223 RepID=A0AAE1E6F2_9GAST|nr:hypothetical protein RRG08_003727 [Elysia crispata]